MSISYVVSLNGKPVGVFTEAEIDERDAILAEHALRGYTLDVEPLTLNTPRLELPGAYVAVVDAAGVRRRVSWDHDSKSTKPAFVQRREPLVVPAPVQGEVIDKSAQSGTPLGTAASYVGYGATEEAAYLAAEALYAAIGLGLTFAFTSDPVTLSVAPPEVP